MDRNVLLLVSQLASPSFDQQRKAACDLRLLSKQDSEIRSAIAKSGAIPLLIKLLSSPDGKVQENSATTLLNVSINGENMPLIMEAPYALEFVLHVLNTSESMEAKENSTALLYSLMADEANRPVIGQHPGVIPALINLLSTGSSLAKKDALKALFLIAGCQENRAFVIKNGAVPALLSMVRNESSRLVEDCLAVLAQAAGCPESFHAFCQTSAVPLIADLLETGKPRARDNAASVLLNFCKAGGPPAIEELLKVESCTRSLYSLMTSGSSRGKGKASALLQILLMGDISS